MFSHLYRSNFGIFLNISSPWTDRWLGWSYRTEVKLWEKRDSLRDHFQILIVQIPPHTELRYFHACSWLSGIAPGLDFGYNDITAEWMRKFVRIRCLNILPSSAFVVGSS